MVHQPNEGQTVNSWPFISLLIFSQSLNIQPSFPSLYPTPPIFFTNYPYSFPFFLSTPLPLNSPLLLASPHLLPSNSSFPSTDYCRPLFGVALNIFTVYSQNIKKHIKRHLLYLKANTTLYKIFLLKNA